MVLHVGVETKTAGPLQALFPIAASHNPWFLIYPCQHYAMMSVGLILVHLLGSTLQFRPRQPSMPHLYHNEPHMKQHRSPQQAAGAGCCHIQR